MTRAQELLDQAARLQADGTPTETPIERATRLAKAEFPLLAACLEILYNPDPEVATARWRPLTQEAQ